MSDFYEKLAYGEEGEKKIASLLLKRGVAVMPLYQFKATTTPILLNNNRVLTMPDLCCWSKGEGYFVECKRKNQWVKFKGQFETGLNKHHFDEYKKIKNITGQKVYIFFIHDGDEVIFYFDEISNLEKSARIWSGINSKGLKISKPLILFKKQNLKILR